jgi:hypothetical protein
MWCIRAETEHKEICYTEQQLEHKILKITEFIIKKKLNKK